MTKEDIINLFNEAHNESKFGEKKERKKTDGRNKGKK